MVTGKLTTHMGKKEGRNWWIVLVSKKGQR
jgi:hypothetical protein